MIRGHFRVLTVDLSTGRGKVVDLDGRDTVAGGSGLAASLFEKYGQVEKPWDDPSQLARHALHFCLGGVLHSQLDDLDPLLHHHLGQSLVANHRVGQDPVKPDFQSLFSHCSWLLSSRTPPLFST